MAKILVTGGAGFIGSHLVDKLLEDKNNRVVVIDALKTGSNLKNLPFDGPFDPYDYAKYDELNDLHFYHCDLTNLNTKSKTTTYSLERVFQEEDDIEYIYHLASESHVDRSIQSSLPFTMSNCVGTDNLFNAAKNLLPNLKKVLLFSTDETLGCFGSQETSWTEDSPVAPKNPYSATKAFQEHLARSFYNTYQFPVLISRCSNVYGTRQYPEKLLPVIIRSILENKKIPVYGDGQQIREWTNVSDVANAATFIMEKGNIGETYHIGSEISKVNLDVVKFVLDYLDKNFDECVEYVEDRKGHDLAYSLSASKLRGMGWNHEVSFEKGMRDTINWYLVNTEYWGT